MSSTDGTKGNYTEINPEGVVRPCRFYLQHQTPRFARAFLLFA